MRFLPSLESAVLIKRYKRFLADVTLLSTGEKLTIHCPNPGSMIGVQTPGTQIWIRNALNPLRKLAYTWELSQENNCLVGVNTHLPNLLVSEALTHKSLDPFISYTSFKKEVSCGKNSRLDFLLTNDQDPPCYLEVKNVHLNINGNAAFPDAVTTRGTKHLLELIALKEQGYRAIMLYIVQRSDLRFFTVAEEIDPVYAVTLKKALHLGVEAFCYSCNVSTDGISLGSSLPLNL